VICGHLIPAETGLRECNSLVVAGKDDIDSVFDAEVADVSLGGD